uniref:Uncharacterized protein n=1 Tax=Acrobeloides nanus TaxID=290746 RepID=A0A914DK83_9BILA
MARGIRRIKGGPRNKQADNDEILMAPQSQMEVDQKENTTPKTLKKGFKKVKKTTPSPQEFDEENDGCIPVGDQSIELWEDDWISRDDLVKTVVSTSKGHFLIEADDHEWRSSFYLKAYHQCGLTEEQIREKCKRVSKIKVDKKFNDNGMQQFPSWDVDVGNKDNDKIQC